MKIYSYTLGPIETNSYIIVNEETGEGILIDCGGNEKFIWLECLKNNIDLKYMILTHGHFDHISGVSFFQSKGVKVLISEEDKELLKEDRLNLSSKFGIKFDPSSYDEIIQEGDNSLCGLNFKVLKTPGHTDGSITLLFEEDMFSGDTLFKDGFGRTDFTGGDYDKLIKSVDILFSLEKNYNVYPGHGEKTKLFDERWKNND